MKKKIVAALFVFVSVCCISQTTIGIMAYNILNYTSTDANKTRYADFKTIVNHFQPDVIICSELDDASGAQLLLDSGLNYGGGTAWSKANFVNGTDTDNMLFYKNAKVKLKSQTQITTTLRDISHYRIYHVISPGDSAYINLFSAHLKAGNTAPDETDRFNECTSFCNYISSLPQNENLIIGGDFNMYSNLDQAWNLLTGTGCAHQFYDPINLGGAWNNNSAYVSIHTQSTRTSTYPGCCGGSTGGMDDRFDFLLATSRVINGGSKVKYIQGTYKACGQDGNHFNKAITESPANSVVPASVATALFNMSDHLPVYMEVEVGSTVGMGEQSSFDDLNLHMAKDVFGISYLSLYTTGTENGSLNIMDLSGKIVHTSDFQVQAGYNTISTAGLGLSAGTYISRFTDKKGRSVSCLFILE